MTVLLDLPAHVAGRVEADAKAHNLSVADLLRGTVIGLYDTPELTADPSTEADAQVVKEALDACEAGENHGENAAQSFAQVAGPI